MKGKAVTARTDGASRGNPGPAGIGVVLEVAGDDRTIERFEYIGEATNNVAEYRALLLALAEAADLSPHRLRSCPTRNCSSVSSTAPIASSRIS